jgi:hypothetical protein
MTTISLDDAYAVLADWTQAIPGDLIDFARRIAAELDAGTTRLIAAIFHPRDSGSGCPDQIGA